MTDAGSRHLLGLADLDDASFHQLLERADALDAAPPPPSLTGRTVANLFFEPSTRTRASFELAATRLGAHVLNLDIPRSSTSKGETLVDTVRALQAMQVDTFVVRHRDDGILRAAVSALGNHAPSFVNAGEGRSEHPTQGLIDALAVQRRFGDCAGLRIAIIGDIAHSRVARSSAIALSRLGAEVCVAGPVSLLPDAPFQGARLADGFDDAISGAMVVMMLRVQRERMAAGGAPDDAAYHAEWGLTRARLARAAKGAVVMHPGPFNRGVEIASDVADGPDSMILDQVALGVPVRMAVLEWVANR
ncbi:MAG: aspartate carbamoyltransferase catalytic subunit [Gammaproteobacteria bacterium]